MVSEEQDTAISRDNFISTSIVLWPLFYTTIPTLCSKLSSNVLFIVLATD